jgi:hypothetical protein
LATLTYCYGNTGDWSSFDVAHPNDNEYLAIMEDYRHLPIPSNEEIELPSNAGFAHKSLVKLPAGVTEVNIRSGNSVFYKVKGSLPANAEAWHYSNVNLNGWTYVEYNTVRGWVSLQSGAVSFVPVVVPEPVDPTLPTTGWYKADATAFAVGADIYELKDQNSRKLGFIKTRNSDDRVQVQTVFNPKQNTWRAIKYGGVTGWVRSDVITFYPNEPEFVLSLSDLAKTKLYDFYPKGAFKVFKTPNLGSFHLEYTDGKLRSFPHIPTDKLNDVQQTVLNNRQDGLWLVITWNNTVSFVRAKDFNEVKPVETVPTNPNAEILKLLVDSLTLMGVMKVDMEQLTAWIESVKDDLDDASTQ